MEVADTSAATDVPNIRVISGPSSTQHKRRSSRYSFRHRSGAHETDQPGPVCGLEASTSTASTSESFQTYRECWNSFQQRIQAVFAESNTADYDSITEFVSNRYAERQRTMVHAQHFKDSKALKRVSTALVFTGGTTAGDGNMFEDLTQRLHQHHHTALLRPEHAGSTGAVMAALLEQLHCHDNQMSRYETLQNWYAHLAAPAKTGAVVIIVQATDCFERSVLDNLLALLGEHADVIPFVLILGVSTTDSTLRRQISGATAAYLDCKRFDILPASSRLNTLVKKVFLQSPESCRSWPVLGHEAAAAMFKLFKQHDSTLHAVMSALHVSLVEHFYNNALGCVYCSPQHHTQEHAQRTCDTLPNASLDIAASLPSAANKSSIPESQGADRWRAIRSELALGLQLLHERHKTWCTAVLRLWDLAERAPKHANMSSLTEVYISFLDSTFLTSVKCEAFLRHLQIALGQHKSEVWEQLLQQWVLALDFSEELTTGEQQLRTTAIAATRALQDAKAADSQTGPTTTVVPATAGTWRNNRERRALLMTAIKPKSQVAKVAEEVAASLITALRAQLAPVESLPFHEVYTLKTAGAIKAALNGSHRTALQRELAAPQKALNCHCCGREAFGPTSDDTCAAYGLLQQSPEFVDISYWYRSFCNLCGSAKPNAAGKAPFAEDGSPEDAAVLTGEVNLGPPKRGRKRKAALQDNGIEQLSVLNSAAMQARFFRATSDLHFVGLFEESTRRRGNAQRLVFDVVSERQSGSISRTCEQNEV
eukprot:jgi/Chlat1/5282/Chrsp35S05236